MIKAYLYLYLRVSAETDDLNFDRSTQAMCRKKIKLTCQRENQIVNPNFFEIKTIKVRAFNTKIEAVIGPRMSNQNMILFSFVVQQRRFSKMMRMTTHDETNMKGNPINQI
jgi:hypothetical protein